MPETTNNASMGDTFAALFEATATRTDKMREGDIVAGTVIKVGKDTVVVDIGYKSEGVIPIDEFLDENGNIEVNAGDQSTSSRKPWRTSMASSSSPRRRPTS
ncbi:MAG: S1 RNA-binding domain-containing protein [Polyangiales bacterium]